ncbi:MAG: hypothetical protein HQ526_00420 [Actinobacteria bacterium]|nr:hypothetical protein [Actinomycetota bacterium]
MKSNAAAVDLVELFAKSAGGSAGSAAFSFAMSTLMGGGDQTSDQLNATSAQLASMDAKLGSRLAGSSHHVIRREADRQGDSTRQSQATTWLNHFNYDQGKEFGDWRIVKPAEWNSLVETKKSATATADHLDTVFNYTSGVGSVAKVSGIVNAAFDSARGQLVVSRDATVNYMAIK